jgi:hypothetical protein
MTTTYLLLSLAFYACSLWCEWAERKSKRWYQDRMLLRMSGACFGLASVLLGLGISE